MKSRILACLLACGLLASACGAKGAEEAAEQSSTTVAVDDSGTEGTDNGSTSGFGDIESPCGPGDATVAADEAGRGTDKLYIGVGNDRDSIRPGLLKELWDGANAFVKWCNDQGGVAGLELEAVDLDGKVLEVAAAMGLACTDVFAIVGGGWAQDDGIFTGRDGADFHKCNMIAYPGFAVSTDFAEASDQIQPLPNPAYEKPASTFEALADLYPEEAAKFGVVYGNLPSITQNKDQVVGVARATDGFGGFEEISYDIISQDWAVIAQQVMDKELGMVSFIGEPPNMSKFSQALKDQGFEGVINADANQYDTRLIEASGPAAVEGAIVRIASRPFEEADKWPAMAQLLKALDDYDPSWQRAGLAVQSFSASLLFATAANACAQEGEITRKCVLEYGMGVNEWNGGGLHATANPGENTPADCAMLVQIVDGKFERLFPELGSDEDNGEGFYCSPTVKLDGDYGKGNTDSSILG